MSRFWDWLKSEVVFPNDVSQARDGLSSERNFLSAVRASLLLTLAAGAILLHAPNKLVPADWVFSVLLLLLALILPVVGFVQFHADVREYFLEHGDVHLNRAMIATVMCCCIVIGAINIYELAN